MNDNLLNIDSYIDLLRLVDHVKYPFPHATSVLLPLARAELFPFPGILLTVPAIPHAMY